MSSLRFQYSDLSPVITPFLKRYGFGPESEISLAGTAGSRRVYWRLRNGSRSLILLASPADDADFGRFLRITQFYRLVQFPVPQVYCIDDAAHQVALEDLGDRRLFDWVIQEQKTVGPTASPSVLTGYRKAVDLIIEMQTRCQALHLECPDIRSRLFDKEQLLWETSYYRAQYLEGHRGITFDAASLTAWNHLVNDLADRVDEHPKAIMHRDFQSQNIMVKEDGSVHVIDYQGSRLGSIFYDLASLLLDPYVMLSDEAIEELLRHYHTRSLYPASFEKMREGFLLAGLQRMMQAMGAYCFLSRVKGISEFAAHIAPGEKRLDWLLNQVQKYLGRGEWDRVLP